MKTCIPLSYSNPSELFEAIKQNYNSTDIIEIWLGEIFQTSHDIDQFSDQFFIDLKQTKEECENIPLLINIKDQKEKGSFRGTDEQKIDLLAKSLDIGCEYVDIDYLFDEELIRKLKKETQKYNATLILSAHFFEGTPSFPSLKNRIQIMQNKGADIVKIAAMPENHKDVVSIIRLSENLERKKIKNILISMGEMGKITRILCPLWGSYLGFVLPVGVGKTAPGQIEIDEYKILINSFE